MRRAVSLAAVTILTTLSAIAVAAGLDDEPDSLTSVLGLDLRGQLEETSGAKVMDFRLHVSADRSRISWWRERTLYVYTVTGPAHEQRAAALVEAMRQGGLVTFVAQRRPKRHPSGSSIAEVTAMQIGAPAAVAQ